MDIILVHIGDGLPPHIYDCIKQLHIWGNDSVYLVTNKNNSIEYQKYKTIVIPIEELCNYDKILEYERIQYFDKKLFWDVTCKRLFYLEAAMKLLRVEKTWHIENDNLAYCDLNEQAQYWSFHKNQVILTKITDSLAGAGIMLVNDIHSLSIMNQSILNMMTIDKKKFTEMHGNEFVSEMRLLGVITENVLPENYYFFPTINKDCSCQLYDSASWGQLLDGIPHHKAGEPFVHESHIIGRYLLSLPENERKINWSIDGEGRKYPHFKGDKLNNIHVHSKRLNLWMSK